MCGPKFCSMEITQQIRDAAEAEGVSTSQVIKAGLAQKAADYVRSRR
jgi:phosphomethylpyrimidine synthase